MGVAWDRGEFYFVKRVPRRLADVDARTQVRVCLHTDSRHEAEAKARDVELELVAHWEARAAAPTRPHDSSPPAPFARRAGSPVSPCPTCFDTRKRASC